MAQWEAMGSQGLPGLVVRKLVLQKLVLQKPGVLQKPVGPLVAAWP